MLVKVTQPITRGVIIYNDALNCKRFIVYLKKERNNETKG